MTLKKEKKTNYFFLYFILNLYSFDNMLVVVTRIMS